MSLYQTGSTYKINNYAEYRQVRNHIEEQLEILSTTENALFAKLAFSEALNNAVDHGEFPIKIEINNATAGELLIKIRDSGKGFAVNEKMNLIENYSADQLLKERLYDERGRGVYIMFKSVQKVIFNDTGNEVTLVISSQ